MATNPKIKRQWIKEEKRIVYLLYRKGLLKDFKIEDLYWAEYHWFRGKKYKSRTNSYDGKRYRYPVYMPEIHYFYTDYWGEGDEDWDSTSDEFPKSTFNMSMTRRQLIKYLESLPTKIKDKKINKVLNTQKIDE